MKLLKPNDKIIANTRPLWHKALARLGGMNDNVVALTADVSRSVCTEDFRKAFPNRFYNVGIDEQFMIGMAAGLALEGKIPYCSSFSPFLCMRAIEQFRTDACYMNLPVRMVGCFSGVSADGATHSGLEDAGFIRGIPNAAVVAPSDPTMIDKVFDASLEYNGPMYIRLNSGANESIIYDEDYHFEIGKAILAKPGKDVVIFSFGITLKYAVEAAQQLENQGISVCVVDVPSLKPLDTELICDLASSCGRVITVEDHSIYNGLGSAVAETLLENGISCKFKRLGMPDVFPTHGPAVMLHDKYGYGSSAVIKNVMYMME